jgi:hypothetical protein
MTALKTNVALARIGASVGEIIRSRLPLYLSKFQQKKGAILINYRPNIENSMSNMTAIYAALRLNCPESLMKKSR